MEFSLSLPHQLNKDGTVLQEWTCFTERFKYYQNSSSDSDQSTTTTSLLLFAAQHQMSSIVAALKDRGLDSSKLFMMLEIVEEICLPYFIVLFERFRYFTLCQHTSETVQDFANILKKQADICEFGDQKDSVLREALASGTAQEHSQSRGACISDPNIAISHSKVSKAHQNNEIASNDGEFKNEREGRVKPFQSPSSNRKSRTRDSRILVKLKSHKEKPKPRKKDKKSFQLVKTGLNLKKATKEAKGKNYSCCLCKKSFVGKKCFEKHFLSKHTDGQGICCKHCDAVFTDAIAFTNHYKVHISEHGAFIPNSRVSKVEESSKRIPCDYCSRIFVKEEFLKNHVKSCHGDCMSFLCWNCEETLPDIRAYRQHSDKHILKNQFSCELCQKKHHSITRLIGHLKNHLVSRVKCEICGMVFAKPQYVAKHREKHHTNEPAHECEICKKSFLTDARLQYHIQRHTGEKRYTCELCGKSFSQKMSFDYHKLWHSGAKPYACDICGKQYRSTGDLTRHKFKHTNKRPHVCELCGKGFRYSSSLIEHRKGHSDVRSYQCDVCLKTFIYRSGLRNHIREARCPGPGMGTGNPSDRRQYSRTAPKLKTPHPTPSVAPMNPKTDLPVEVQAPPESYSNPLSWHCMVRNSDPEGASSVVLIPPFY